MKKTLITVLALLLALSLATVVSAQGDELKSYVEEKIAPILVGVMTSIIALLGTLRGIFSMVKGVCESKEIFENQQKTARESSRKFFEEMKDKYQEIKNDTESVSDLKREASLLRTRVDDLCLEIANLSEIARAGFLRDKDLIKEGKARKIEILANKNRELVNDDKP